MPFTFKTIKPKGRWASFNSNENQIKLNKKQVGSIDDEIPFKIRLMIIKKDIGEDGNTNCPWKWIQLKHEFESIKQAQIWLNQNFERLNKIYTFHFSD